MLVILYRQIFLNGLTGFDYEERPETPVNGISIFHSLGGRAKGEREMGVVVRDWLRGKR